MLEVQEIHTYYEESHILQGISLRVPPKNLIGLLGRNGVGKTTLVRSIIGFTPPRRGKITFNGTDTAALAPEQIARLGIGLVPQGRRVFRSLTVEENLKVAAYGRGDDGWSVESMFEVFPRLKERASHPASKLSGGEQQILSIARSLMGNPDLLLMDEPTEGLAPLIVKHVGDVLCSLMEKGLSILLVEQNLGFTCDLASHIYVMNKGEIVYESSAKQFQKDEGCHHTYLGI